MTTIDEEWYFHLANELRRNGTLLAQALDTANSALEVSQSAGTHLSAGMTWASVYDQVSSDLFEGISMAAMASYKLGGMIHDAGLAHLEAENMNNSNGAQQAAPPLDSGTSLDFSKHPTALSIGGIKDIPKYWDLVDALTTRTFPDPDVGKLRAASSAWAKLASDIANSMVHPAPPAGTPPPDAAKILDAVDKINSWRCQLVEATLSFSRRSKTSRGV